jgi:hypothetical protein
MCQSARVRGQLLVGHVDADDLAFTADELRDEIDVAPGPEPGRARGRRSTAGTTMPQP